MSRPSRSQYSGASSAESTNTAATQYSVSSGNTYVLPAAYNLPCEFVIFGCNESFGFDQANAWVEHIVDEHLKNRLPSKAVCWFCDTYTFDAKAPGRETDVRSNFYNRMEHIRDHIGEGASIHSIRPDFHMADHLRRCNLIPPRLYNIVRNWHELPCPREQVRHVHPPDYIPPEIWQQRERSYMTPIDLEKEDRQQRKEQKQKQKQKGSHGHQKDKSGGHSRR